MNHFDLVDDALKAVETARKINRKGSSKQVQGGEERDHMRTVASVWFQGLRPDLETILGNGNELAAVDEPMRRVWDATAKAAARSTYKSALDSARKALLGLRKQTPVSFENASVPETDDSPPDFSPLATQDAMQKIMARRWAECSTCLGAGANLAAVVMMGGLIESLFVSKANHLSDKSELAKAKRAPTEKGKPIPFQKWTLNNYIEVGHELGWIGDIAKSVSAVLRDYRNFIHPQAELTRGHTVQAQDARLLWTVTKAVIRELLATER